MLGCRKKTCRRKDGSVRGFRATRASKIEEPARKQEEAQPPKQEEAAQPKQDLNIGASLFGVKAPVTTSTPANPFSTSSAPSASANPFSSPANPFAAASSLAAKPAQPPTKTSETDTLPETFASKARISSPPPAPFSSLTSGPAEPWPSPSAFPTPYPRYSLDADYETLDATPPPIPQQTRLDPSMDMELDSGSGSGSGSGGDSKEDKNAFESAMDTAFQKFADRLAQNPEQVLRYEFGGVPLLYSREDSIGSMLALGAHGEDGNAKVKTTMAGKSGSGMPRCGNCGADRVFECQLTPHAITELEAEELGIEGMEWGTVILGVCGRDCGGRGVGVGEVGYVEEWVGVQWEEVVKRK